MSFSVIIPSRNAANLVPCMEAVRRHEPGARIVMVDDGFDKSWLPRPDLEPGIGIAGAKPFVFARNVNIGIRAAGGDDVVILNDDALLETPFGFTAMWGAANNNPEYGLIGATCNNVGNQAQRPRCIVCGWPIAKSVQEGCVRGNCSLRPAPAAMAGPLRDEPRMVCFVAVLIPRRTIEAVGLLDERYVGYGCDDDDYSFSVRKAGLKLGIHDGCYVDHGRLRSSYRGDATMGGDFRPNLARYIEKWGVDNWGQPRETSRFRELFPQETHVAR